MKPCGLLLCVLLLCLTGQAVKPVSAAGDDKEGGEISRQFGSVTISIDPRIELLTAAQLLCDDYRDPRGRPIVGGMLSSYRRDVLNYFSPYKSHEIVSLTAEMGKHAFWLGHPLRAALCRSGLPGLEPRHQPDGLQLALAGGQENLDEYFNELADFARQSDFDKFFKSQASQYQRMIETFFSANRRNYPQDIEEFFGTTQKEYNLIFSPLNNYCGYGQRIQTGENQYTTYVVIGPNWITADSLPDFNWEHHNIFWHEFSHPHVNPIVEANIDELLSPCTPLQPVKPEEVAAYGVKWEVQVADWVGEHVVRASEACMMDLYVPEMDRAEFFAKQKKWGFPFVSEVYAALKLYEQNRDRYPRFETFFPEIIAVFEQIEASSATNGE